ncbi:hypothetical protein ACFXDJ_14140 [Streptomyces sp. NPDC059443]|uniref:hypothetical protein n=1 Tax=unclassified Streptomyces TaxID=2593676 RepID=UPI0036814A42
MKLRKRLRRRPDTLWWECASCGWLGHQWTGPDAALKEIHRYEGDDALCPWCGDDDMAMEEGPEDVRADGVPGRWMTDMCLSCGRVGAWFRGVSGERLVWPFGLLAPWMISRPRPSDG